MKLRFPAVFSLAWTSLATAANVEVTQVSNPEGIFQLHQQTVEVGGTLDTLTATETSGSQRFIGWFRGDGTRLMNANGQSLNPATLTISAEETLTARYVEEPESDGDGIPDWYEQRHFGDLSHPTDDADGDGYTLYEEWYRNTNPQAVDATVTFRAGILQP